MIVRWTESALADLESIQNYQGLHWPAMRARFEARLTAIERRIGEFPLGAPEVEQRPGVRVAAFLDFPYRLFYRPEAGVIEVLAIRHTSRRPLF
jgi:toxin ParE1/3/4